MVQRIRANAAVKNYDSCVNIANHHCSYLELTQTHSRNDACNKKVKSDIAYITDAVGVLPAV